MDKYGYMLRAIEYNYHLNIPILCCTISFYTSNIHPTLYLADRYQNNSECHYSQSSPNNRILTASCSPHHQPSTTRQHSNNPRPRWYPIHQLNNNMPPSHHSITTSTFVNTSPPPSHTYLHFPLTHRPTACTTTPRASL
jgi:hypothetical protein